MTKEEQKASDYKKLRKKVFDHYPHPEGGVLLNEISPHHFIEWLHMAEEESPNIDLMSYVYMFEDWLNKR